MYKYYNATPSGEHIGDCVIRAISVGTGIPYYNVIDKLYNITNYFNCDMLVKDCYSKLLDKYTDEKHKAYFKKTVKEIADEYKNAKVIMRIEGHLTVSRFNIIYDTWDTSNELVDTFWVIY